MGGQNALELAHHGASLIIEYFHSGGSANAVVDETIAFGAKAIAIKADISKSAEITALFKEAIAAYGHLDNLGSNSGIESFGSVSQITAKQFDRGFAINTRGQLLVAQQPY